jgi:hypothetical protein
MNKSIIVALAIAAIALGTVGIVTTIGMSQAYAINNGNSDCGDRNLISGCSPGQHLNDQSGKVAGNPHYPMLPGGDENGDPHGNTFANPSQGDPHCQFSSPAC